MVVNASVIAACAKSNQIKRERTVRAVLLHIERYTWRNMRYVSSIDDMLVLQTALHTSHIN